MRSPRTVEFSGYTWRVKGSVSAVGPGPNRFSSSTANVFVDALGSLHLRIIRANRSWRCAEVINTQSLGRGRYIFELASAVDDLDPNVVLGLFTWSDDDAHAHREIDIELARWGNAADPTNGQYVVQPCDRDGHLQRVTQSPAASSTHWFEWRTDEVRFGGSEGRAPAWAYAGPDVPPPRDEHVRINLWLHGGAPPGDGRHVEVVVASFGFEPARMR